jgi:hypothetical protein
LTRLISSSCSAPSSAPSSPVWSTKTLSKILAHFYSRIFGCRQC